ncbi:MAG: rod shape-determining protein MreD [Cohnella sp.]|uniref:rod shape-determining protein MreD n=1 Tax=Cohnella sp. TaxID=1883426 RepID=UPI000E36E205|nr:rod shape-determining protein MreD [Cohnella sp.]REK62905.1 MAG: rod shape-determining protein MreD [Cohnella sp.]
MRMNWTILATVLLLLFQTSVLPWLVPPGWSDRLLPHLPFIMTVFVALYGNRHRAFFFGLGFGLLEDVLFYGKLIGAYGFSMALLGYLLGLIAERRPRTLSFTLVSVALGSALLDMMVYGIYDLFQLVNVTFAFAVYWHIVPTLLISALLALLLYIPVRRWLVKNIASSAEENGG